MTTLDCNYYNKDYAYYVIRIWLKCDPQMVLPFWFRYTIRFLFYPLRTIGFLFKSTRNPRFEDMNDCIIINGHSIDMMEIYDLINKKVE